MKKQKYLIGLLATVLVLTGCSSSSDDSAAGSSSCEVGKLSTVTDGVLTIATGEPAYYPWVIDDAPESGEGFEAAVAYAVASELGYDQSAVNNVMIPATCPSVALTPFQIDTSIAAATFSTTNASK